MTQLAIEKISLIAKASAKLSEKVLARKCETSLIDYASYVWPIVEPSIPFVKGWVLEAISEHLEAVSYGHIKRLLINVPPGFTKSLMTDVFWPSWEWGPLNRPSLRYVCASYSNHLTIRDNMRCRNIVVSERYQRLWGNRFGIDRAQFDKVKFGNNKTGWKLATSIGGVGVGERGDRFIIDDANNTMEMESETTRYTTNMWFTEVVPDRLNNQKDSAIVVIQQRLHEEDVSGVAISRNMGYTHLMVPMEYDIKRHCVTVLGVDELGDEVKWEDPRSIDGEIAWPERFPPETILQLKNDKGPYAWSGQYLQSPAPRGGAILKDEFWQLWESDKYPSFEFILASLDTAYTEKQENDPSALTIWGLFRDPNKNPKLMLIHAWQERMALNDLVVKVIDSCTVDSRVVSHPRFPVDRLLIESKAAGISVAQELSRLIGFTGQFGVELVNPQKQGDKVARVHAIQHLFSEGMVYAPDKEWADMVIQQAAVFPRGSHDDLVDSLSMAMRYMRDVGLLLRRDEHSLYETSKLEFKGRTAPLYPV